MTAPILWKRPGASGLPVLADYREWDGPVLPSGATGSAWAAVGLPLLPAAQRTWYTGATSAGVATANGSIVDTAGPGYNIVLGVATQALKFAPQLVMPWWLNPALFPAAFTRRLRYTWSCIVEVSAPSSTEKAQVGLTNLGADLASGGPGQSGIQLAFDNGGTNTWRVRSRLTPLGALVLGNDAQIGAGTRFLAAFRYTQFDVPTVEVLVNNAVLQTFAGVAALPVPAVLPAFPAAAVSGGFQPTVGMSGALGGTASLITRQSRYLLEELAA